MSLMKKKLDLETLRRVFGLIETSIKKQRTELFMLFFYLLLR